MIAAPQSPRLHRISDVMKDPRIRILHLAFADHLRPGSGGMEVRTREINRRIAVRHDVTVVTSVYPGSRDRVEDGVRYVHIGANLGYFGSMLAYFAALPLAVRRHSSDLIIEDFAPPFASVAVPRWTRRPVIGLVQWLFARQKAIEYRVPFHLVERAGVRSHRRMIAVSCAIARDLSAINPAARVDVIPEGVEAEAFRPRARPRRGILFLGRVEFAQKGVDLLLHAFHDVAGACDANLTIAGDGRDLERARRLCQELGMIDRVRFAGRVSSPEKFDLIAGAEVLCMPSRYETFGITAAEALACGTPVVGFDLDSLREVVPSRCGVLVPPGSVPALARALLNLVCDPARRGMMGEAGRAWARQFDWDRLAERQEAVIVEEARLAV
jgi:glycosyltransferase involved in cell wall biosynthesis